MEWTKDDVFAVIRNKLIQGDGTDLNPYFTLFTDEDAFTIRLRIGGKDYMLVLEEA